MTLGTAIGIVLIAFAVGALLLGFMIQGDVE